MLLKCGVGKDSWESLGLQGDPTSPFWRRSVLNIHWKDWCWSWKSNSLATWCAELTHLKRPWCWERLKVGGEGDDWGWDGWMASLTQWTWVWVNSRSWWWTGNPACCSPWGRKGSDTTERLNWTEDLTGAWKIWIPLSLCLWPSQSTGFNGSSQFLGSLSFPHSLALSYLIFRGSSFPSQSPAVHTHPWTVDGFIMNISILKNLDHD